MNYESDKEMGARLRRDQAGANGFPIWVHIIAAAATSALVTIWLRT